jgi:hypothetical protein
VVGFINTIEWRRRTSSGHWQVVPRASRFECETFDHSVRVGERTSEDSSMSTRDRPNIELSLAVSPLLVSGCFGRLVDHLFLTRTHPRLVRMQGRVFVVRPCTGTINVCPVARKNQDPVTISFLRLL